ncbi:MAG TPA: hypothetical protein VGL95_12330, partial [Acetobacteraceae bacterium]
MAAEQERRGTVLSVDFEPRKLRHHRLKSMLRDGEHVYMLLLSETDRMTLKALVDDARMPDFHNIRIKQSYELSPAKWEKCTVAICTQRSKVPRSRQRSAGSLSGSTSAPPDPSNPPSIIRLSNLR